MRYSLQRAIEAVAVETVSISTWSISLWKEQILPLPNYEYQRKLADYLDEKCTKIDAIIEKQQEILCWPFFFSFYRNYLIQRRLGR